MHCGLFSYPKFCTFVNIFSDTMTNPVLSKTILSKLKNVPDLFFGVTYNMNLYRGCQHGCIYCDSRSLCYHIRNFDDVDYKANAIELLHKELKRHKNKATIGFGSMNDPYMPLEKNLLLARRALEVIHFYRFPIHIITKSILVNRDVDILQQVSQIYCAVSFTITTADDVLSRKIEPGAPVSSERFKAMSVLAKAGIYTGVVISPVLPFITDTAENIIRLIALCHYHGAAYILCWPGMTLREGQREYFYRQLDDKFPGIADKYRHYYGNTYACDVPQSAALMQTATIAANQYKIPLKMKFYSPPEIIQKSLFK